MKSKYKGMPMSFLIMATSLLIVSWPNIEAFAHLSGGEGEQARPTHYIVVGEEIKLNPQVKTMQYEIQAQPNVVDEILEITSFDEDLLRYICDLCAEYDVRLETVLAVIECESNFDPDVIGITNDYGLMQISPLKLQDLEDSLQVTDVMDPYQNVKIGIHILSDLISKYEGHQIFMAYNMGDGGMKKAVSKGYDKTDYSVKVMNASLKWAELLGGKQ